MAVISFGLGSAPFTPALFLAPLALALGSVSAYLGHRRLAAVTGYWAVAALLTVPMARMWQLRIDSLLLVFVALGFLLGAVLFTHYAVSKRAH
jgi:hypothetical protein